MKIICTIILILTFTIPVLPQRDNISSNKDLENQALNTLKDLVSSIHSGKRQGIICEKPGFTDKNNFRFIPIPPAKQSDSKSELLPLYKNGNRIMKLLKK